MFGRREPRLITKLDEVSAVLREEFELNRHEFELNRHEHELNRREHELTRREFELNREALANHRAVTGELIRQIRDSVEENRRHNEAVVGALTDLAAEIRGWGGGPAAA